MIRYFRSIVVVALVAWCVATVAVAASDKYSALSARIESCKGCSLNRLPEVKKFILNDAPNYEGVEVKFISGAPPELILLGEGDVEMERLPLSNLNREQCNHLLQDKGFKKIKNTEF